MMELIMFAGIPGSGKSTESEKYRRRGYQIFSSDEIRSSMMQGGLLETYSEKDRKNINGIVFAEITRKAGECLARGESVVVDATNLVRKRRMSFLKQMEKYDCTKKCVLFVTPVDICRARNAQRSTQTRVPDGDMFRMICSFECPNLWEGWDEIVPVVHSEAYRFPFEQIQGFSQDNHHHALTLDEHMTQAARYCKEQGLGDMLERVAAYHDIGKLYTKRFCNFRGVPTAEAHYLGHDHYGAYLYLTEMCCGKTLSAEELSVVLYETCLINCHMRPLTAWDEAGKAKKKDEALFGRKFIEDLTALNRADRAAH